MTKQEFTERTGIQVNDTDFNAINNLYMNAGYSTPYYLKD